MTPYAILSDIHFHAWSAFSSVDADGINSRLRLLCNEVERACQVLQSRGGHTVLLAGDLFHVRGNIAPSVLNPVRDLFRSLKVRGFRFCAIPGNHDLEGKNSNRLLSAVTALEESIEVFHTAVADFPVYGSEHGILYMPWQESLSELRELLMVPPPEQRATLDVLMHAPLDGVLASLDGHGLDPKWVADLGFKRVFCGHYHHHKLVAPYVYSIGALAHHTWSDVGTKAGFLLVDDDGVTWQKSHLPEFIDIAADTDPDMLPLIVDGNYVRAKTESTKLKDIDALRKLLTDAGAKGVVIQSVKAPTTARDTSVVKSGESLEDSLASYVKAMTLTDGVDAGQLQTLCADILLEAGNP